MSYHNGSYFELRLWLAIFIRWARNRIKHHGRKRRLRLKREWLINQLGGPKCAAPDCPGEKELSKSDRVWSIHHVDFDRERGQMRDKGQERRINELISDFKKGKRLQVMHLACNRRIQPVDDVPF